MSSSLPNPAILLRTQGISKAFRGVQALSGVDFAARAGEVHALMGENGAGKSTLIKAITGVHQPDAGTIEFRGEPFAPRSPIEAQQLGLSTVYQEINLVPYLSVAENIYLGRQPRRCFFGIRWREINRRASEALGRLGIQIDVGRPLASYSTAVQQMTAIARALDLDAKLLILDEPTSSLDADEVERLFSVMRLLREQGMGIVFITHFLGQVYEMSDRITVLRNGRLVGEYATKDLPRIELISAMLGREFKEAEAGAPAAAAEVTEARKPFVTVRGLSRRGKVEGIDLEVAAGEIVGLAGLLGSGRTETARLLFGLDHADSGEILVDNCAVKLRSPSGAVKQAFGFCPEDRKTHGIVPELSVRENMILAVQGKRKLIPVSRREQQKIVDKYIKALNIATPDSEQQIRNLSGGNQQKVILARWLASNPRFMILDEPTRGIDVGARAEIEKLLADLAADGMAILLISSELDEIVRCCTRVVVLRDRRKVGELGPGEATEDSIMHIIASQGAA